MNISGDRSGAKIIVLVVAAAVLLAASWLIYSAANTHKQLNEQTSVCKQRGTGTHVVTIDTASGRQTTVVVVCNRDGTSQVLQQP